MISRLPTADSVHDDRTVVAGTGPAAQDALKAILAAKGADGWTVAAVSRLTPDTRHYVLRRSK
jgi:hypothetical protein